MARRERNGFKKLLGNVKMNALSQDSNGEWTLINSATNKRRMKYGGAGLAYDSDPEFAVEGNDRWIPAKCYITEMDLREIWHDQGEVCYWFKIPLDFNLLFASCPDYMPKHPLAPSVDRIATSRSSKRLWIPSLVKRRLRTLSTDFSYDGAT